MRREWSILFGDFPAIFTYLSSHPIDVDSGQEPTEEKINFSPWTVDDALN
jgi:hypothetical protein